MQDLKNLYQSRCEFAFISKMPLKEVLELPLEMFEIVRDCWNEYAEKRNREIENSTKN